MIGAIVWVGLKEIGVESMEERALQFRVGVLVAATVIIAVILVVIFENCLAAWAVARPSISTFLRTRVSNQYARP